MEFKAKSNFRGHLDQSPHFIHNLCYCAVFTIGVKYKQVQYCAKQSVRIQPLSHYNHLFITDTYSLTRNELSIYQQVIIIVTQVINKKQCIYL